MGFELDDPARGGGEPGVGAGQIATAVVDVCVESSVSHFAWSPYSAVEAFDDMHLLHVVGLAFEVDGDRDETDDGKRAAGEIPFDAAVFDFDER